VAVVATPALFDGVALPSAWAAALLSLALTAPVAGASALLWWCAAEAALLCLGLAAVVVIDAPVASVLSEVAVLCLLLAAAVVIVSSPGALAPARPAGRLLEGTLLPLVSFLRFSSACSSDHDTYLTTLHGGHHREAAICLIHT
jgi:hypothetical protein